METKPNWIYKDIVSTICGSESSRVYLSVNTFTGKSELIIEKTIIERYPVKKYEEVMDLHDRLTCGSGRKVISLKDIAHPYNPNK